MVLRRNHLESTRETCGMKIPRPSKSVEFLSLPVFPSGPKIGGPNHVSFITQFGTGKMALVVRACSPREVFSPIQISRGMYLYLCTHVDFFAFALRSRLVNRGQYSDMGVIFLANHSSYICMGWGGIRRGVRVREE